MFKTIYIIIFLVLCNTVFAKGTYLEPKDFIARVYESNLPKVKKLWIKKELKENINNILGHDLAVIRIRYWDDGDKSAWILEEIGRDKPITVGIVVKENKIEQLNVLIFRESRGWEVRYPFFTDQYKDITLSDEKQLSKKIDGISGATLSVNALTKLARLALYFDQQIRNK